MHLPGISVTEAPYLEVHHQEATQPTVEEQQVYPEPAVVEP